MMRGQFADSARGYLIAVLGTLTATWGQLQFRSDLGDPAPFALYYVSVLVTAWLAGTFPAIVAFVLGVISALGWVIPFHRAGESMTSSDKIALFLFCGVSSTIIWLFHRSAVDRLRVMQSTRENEDLWERLQASDRKKDEFLALLAHELRNPLAPIRTGLEILEREPVDATRHCQIRRTMGRQLDQLTRMVDDLLDVSRFLQGQMRLYKETIDIRQVVDSAVETCQPILDHNEHLVQFVRPKSPLYVHADRVRLAQVVANLLTNAAKYTPRRGKIRIFLETNAAGLSLHVQDNGIGIPRDAQTHIFELFSQVNPSETRDHGGLGLGLTIVRQLTQLHGGSATVFSEGPGRGSRFTINLPTVSPPVSKSAETVCGMGDTKISIPVVGSGILIVDDNADAADTLAALLSFEGYETHVAHDGPTALTKFDEQSPQIVLLDIGMPGMDGYQVVRELRSRPEGRRARIMALTGWGGERDRRRTLEAGFDEHLVKPIEFDQLVSLLHESPTIVRR